MKDGKTMQEPTLLNCNQKKMQKLHKLIMIQQFSKYLKLKVKFNFLSKILMFFLKKDFLKEIAYKVSGKTKL